MQSTNAGCPPPGTDPGRKAQFDPCKYSRLGPGIHAARPLSLVDPDYSEPARKAKIMGTVVVGVALSERGEVDDVKVLRSLELGLDQNAVDAVKQSKFAPATKDGRPLAVQFEMEMTFKLY